MALFQPSTPSNCSASLIHYLDIPGSTVRLVEAVPVSKGRQIIPAGLYSNNPSVSSSGVDFCNVTVTYTIANSQRNTSVQVWLPTEEWNQRIQAIGGGGWNAGLHDSGLVGMTAAVIQGYTAIGTNGGYPPGLGPESWDVLEDGKIDLLNFQHYATTSLRDLSIVGKSVVNSFYGRPAKYSYWNGCSQGGRQGFTLAQNYADAFDGIVASAPVVNWGQLMPAGFWAQATMNEIGEYPRACELKTLSAAAVKACDGSDGLVDGLISDPDSCTFDPSTLVNTKADCGVLSDINISPAAIKVAQTGWDGMRTSVHRYMWEGNNHQAALVTEGSIPMLSGLLPYLNITTGLADTDCFANGTCTGRPFDIPRDWIKYFVLKDANYDASKIKVKEFDEFFSKSVEEYGPIIGTDSPDMTAFAKSGGKILSYHGSADSIIPSWNSRKYHDAVLAFDPKAHDYYRLFEAPGVGHCWTGTGLYPSGIFESLQVISPMQKRCTSD
ncbi:feruloyl esterase b precursor [Venturia nashicola]|uniref:Carboxylic ester hydrolase n=1 Tax=Venturia nashicola TaxID=86259 RepID=A0A4Z1NZJ7_9PEZI|nr:feruloyl esterase b precursor [Venturia nashicola]